MRLWKWYSIEKFHDLPFKPLFYIGSDGTVDSCEVLKYKGEIPPWVKVFAPLEFHATVDGPVLVTGES